MARKEEVGFGFLASTESFDHDQDVNFGEHGEKILKVVRRVLGGARWAMGERSVVIKNGTDPRRRP